MSDDLTVALWEVASALDMALRLLAEHDGKTLFTLQASGRVDRAWALLGTCPTCEGVPKDWGCSTCDGRLVAGQPEPQPRW